MPPDDFAFNGTLVKINDDGTLSPTNRHTSISPVGIMVTGPTPAMVPIYRHQFSQPFVSVNEGAANDTHWTHLPVRTLQDSRFEDSLAWIPKTLPIPMTVHLTRRSRWEILKDGDGLTDA